MQGWVSLHRKLLSSDIFQNEKLLKVFIYCLLKATHTEHSQKVGKQTVQLNPGQFVFGRRKAALELDMKESTVRDYINVLKDDGAITIKSTNKFSVITLVNWEFYQDKEKTTDKKADSKTPTKGQQNDTNNNGNKGNNANNNKKPSRPKQVYDKESIPYQLASRLFMRIKENNPNAKEPNLQKWSDDIRKMIQYDKRTEEQVKYLIDWSQKDSFWSSNILSPSKLRKQFDQLVLKIKSDREVKKGYGQQKRKLITTEKPEHIPDPEVPDDIDEQINEILNEI